MEFPEAMEYVKGLTKFGFNFGLGRIEELLRRLGNPHLFLDIIHVGGTNGKGSTIAMLSAILQEAGWRVGAFTSPHLHSYTERFRINGVNIPEDTCAKLISQVCPHLDAMVAEGFEHPTEFEVATAVAFLYFYREKVDLLLLEVGLGGAIDSTNVVKPLVSVITNVAMDHMDYLGHTIREIAGVKAGIIKPGVPVVTAAVGEGLEVIEEVSRENNSPLIKVGQDVTWEHVSLSQEKQQFNIHGRFRVYENLTLYLIGRHQQVNAATAVAAAETLLEQGVPISEAAVRSGLSSARWPARLEIMGRNPLVLIDGAHNFDGARALRQALSDTFPERSIVLLIGMLGDKERARVVAELAPLARVVVVTRPNNPRAGNWQELAREAKNYVDEVYMIENIGKALDKALALAGPEELVCVTGSLYMVAEARQLLLDLRDKKQRHFNAMP